MEESRIKRAADPNREKYKKKSFQEKKTKSDTAAFSSSSFLKDQCLENFVLVGKGCHYGKSKSYESGYRLHECYSESDISPLPESTKNFRDIIQGEGLQNIASNSSFVSAKSDFSDAFQKRIHDLEDTLSQQIIVISSLKKQIGDKKIVEVNSVSTETDLSITDIEEHKLKLKVLEKKVSHKEKKIKELELNLEECLKVKDNHIEENKVLKNQVGLFKRQIQSLFDLLKKKNWTTIDPTEFAQCKNKITELEALIASQEQEKNELSRKFKCISSSLESREKELSVKSRELIDYKNRSTLEMCKLINQIDCLQKEARSQSQLLDFKVSEAQNFMDQEVVNITLKLEEQYQKDVTSAVEKFHADFERLADLPKTAIEKLLQFCESDKIDFISYQKEWEKQQKMLEEKIESLEVDHCKEIKQLKDNYETKIIFLKTQIEALFSQLKERKDIIDIFETELMTYKSNSTVDLLKASSLGDDIFALKELYTAEIFSQKQIHKLQMNIFEEKVKALTNEILYHARNEEIHMQELGNAKKMALAFREKYEKLVSDWEEKAEKGFQNAPPKTERAPELDTILMEVQNLIQSHKKSEQMHEAIVQELLSQNENEKVSLLRDIEDLKKKIQALKNFQKIQGKLDETISNLIETVGVNYSKTIDTFLLSHVTELNVKQMELSACERRHVGELDSLKNDHAKELEKLRNNAESSENAKILAQNEVTPLRKTEDSEKLEALRRKIENISLELMKSEGIIGVKEETERALNEKIEELEETIRLKEENCRQELEDLAAKYLKEKVLSSAKDDLAKELEDGLNKSESLLEKSCEVVDHLIDLCSNLENISKTTYSNDEGYQMTSQNSRDKFLDAKTNFDRLNARFLEVFEKVDILEKVKSQNEDFLRMQENLQTELKLSSEKNAALEKERNNILGENKKMKDEMSDLVEKIANKEKTLAEMKSLNEELLKMSDLKEKLKILELEKGEKEKENDKKEEILERKVFVESDVKDLSEQIDQLTTEQINSKVSERQEVLSISLQEVRFFYEEEQEVRLTSTAACQTELSIFESNMRKAKEDSEKENENLKLQMEKRENQLSTSLYEEVVLKYENIQKELFDVIEERNESLMILKNLEKEKDNLEKELESLKKENCAIRARYEAEIKVVADKGLCFEDSGRVETNREIERLKDYIRTLSNNLDIMKANNELLLSESQEHFKLNQNLVTELEEAWSQRYEIEDQLAKVRRENAMLNMHRQQLEETNKKISNLIAEGQPSVVSWIKIHETVESIVDEVLALKTSFSDSGSLSGTATGFDLPRTNSELKLMTDNLHAQLKNKTMLCEELIIQKETLQKELKNLENFILESDSKSRIFKEGVDLCITRKGSRQLTPCSPDKLQTCACDCRSLSEETESEEACHLMTLSALMKHLKGQAELEEGRSPQSWEVQLDELKREIQNMQEGYSEDDSHCLRSIELKYEEEIGELSKEFDKEVKKLKEAFGPEEKNSLSSYDFEIEKLKKYFEKRWADLGNRYAKIYSFQNQKIMSSSSTLQLQQILDKFFKILQEESNEEEKKLKIENLLKIILTQRDNETKTVQGKQKEAMAMLQEKHACEVRKLQLIVFQLKEIIMLTLKRGIGETHLEEEALNNQKFIAEYEAKLEEEKKKHKREILDLEEFWTEKLSDCETKCAILKATRGTNAKIHEEYKDNLNHGIAETSVTEKTGKEEANSEERAEEEKHIANYTKAPNRDLVNYRIKEPDPQDSLCVSCLARQSFFKKMELKTDDDKLDIIQQRDKLEEMVFSMRNIITKLLTLIPQYNPELSNTSDIDGTFYKSIHVDLDQTTSDMSMVSNSVPLTMDLTMIFQDIKENLLLSSSDQILLELEKHLKQLNNDANGLFALSCTEYANRNLKEMIEKIVKEKNELEGKVMKIEVIQNEMKKEIGLTKDRLLEWERNLEVVSEGYGEEIVEPKQSVFLSNLKDKLKVLSTEHCGHSSQDINFLEEICKEGDRLQEEWMKEKCDLQQQIDVADKQLHSLRKFLEEQAVEREQEREVFDREINKLQESLKAKERDSSLQNRTNREVEALTAQIKSLSAELTETEKNKGVVEEEFQNAVKKIWSLREVIQDLELQLAEVSEKESNLKKKVEKLDGLIEEQSNANRILKEELEACRNQNELQYSEHVKSLEEELMRLHHVTDQVNPDNVNQLKVNLRQIEAVLIKKTKDLEQLHVSSANVSCSSPSEDISIRDHLDATRCSTPDEMCSNFQPSSMLLPIEEVDRIQENLARHSRAEEVAIKYIQDLKMQIRNHRKVFDEIQTERDILLEKVDVYLKENSSLKVRLEEQRCNAGLLQKQLNANLESQISQLQVDVEKLNDLCNEKDKQLRDMKIMLENTIKSLKIRETEALNKSKEENTLITTLKTDLANALNENEKLEEKLEKTKEKLRETFKMPALIDSMIEEKNAEIDRLEKEVARLCSEKTTIGVTSKSYGSEEKQNRKIRFSEPESFSENISSISVQCYSDLRNCSDSCANFRNSSFKNRRSVGFSPKLESISSIASLQLSPRGTNRTFNWKTSSPIPRNETMNKSPLKTTPAKPDISQFEEIEKLQKEIESKQRGISELNLEIDILKRQLVEAHQEVDSAKAVSKEIQNDIVVKDEEIRKLKNNEVCLLMTIDSLKKNHTEEVDELHNQLNFERQKVERVYEEIKALEMKKIEIEESFFSLKEDYNEKINAEKKIAETLMHRLKALETRNNGLEIRLVTLDTELNETIRKSEKTIESLSKEISELKTENGKFCPPPSQKQNAETQVEEETCACQKSFTLETPSISETKRNTVPNLEILKAEFSKMATVIREKDFNKKEAFSYAMTVGRLLAVVITRMDELAREVEAHMKKVMEYSVDDLAVKVQKELVLSAKLDNQLLSSIEANGFTPQEATSGPDIFDFAENPYRETGKGDNEFVVPKPLENAAMFKVVGLYKNSMKKIVDLEIERENLKEKVSEQQKIIRLLEDSLKKEKERIVVEKERCSEDAKIMELLRVNLEKRLIDIRAKEKELKKEKHQRMALEKELEEFKKQGGDRWEGSKLTELNAVLESQREKLSSVGLMLEEEKKKTQELKLSLEEERVERMAEKNAQRLMESDLSLLRDQKESFKKELLNLRKLLHSRNVEIGLLKRKINLQEIDLKALSLSNNIHTPNTSDASSAISNTGGFTDIPLGDSSISLLVKMSKLNSCVQHHVKESTEMGEALLHLSQETEQMKDVIRKLEENNDSRLADETLVPDTEVERRLWALEKGRLVMDLEALKREIEVLKRDLADTCKNNDALKRENFKLKSEIRSPKNDEESLSKIEDKFLHERVSHLTRKYMRTESYRKALAWQKHYLLITLQEYQRSEDEAWRRIGRRKKDGKKKGQKHGGRFRVVALAAVAIFRMKFIVKRWQKNALSHVFSLLENKKCKLKLAPLPHQSIVNTYNEPVNPLSYQIQHIFHHSSSQVLRTPPSRDPGLRGFSPDSKNFQGSLAKLDYLQENVGVIEALP